MRVRFLGPCVALALLAGVVGTFAQSTSTAATQKGKDQPPPRQVKVAIDPRSSGETEAELLAPGFHDSCSSVSIVRDESEAAYVVLAGQTQSWGFLHYYITVYDKQGKVAFADNKHLTKNAIKAFCQFINAQ